MTAHIRAVEAKTELPLLSENMCPSFCLEKELKIKGWCRFLFELILRKYVCYPLEPKRTREYLRGR